MTWIKHSNIKLNSIFCSNFEGKDIKDISEADMVCEKNSTTTVTTSEPETPTTVTEPPEILWTPKSLTICSLNPIFATINCSGHEINNEILFSFGASISGEDNLTQTFRFIYIKNTNISEIRFESFTNIYFKNIVIEDNKKLIKIDPNHFLKLPSTDL